MRTPNKRVELELQRNPVVGTRFWSHVDRSEDTTTCWEWTGRCHGGKPVFQVCGSSIAPARIAWLWSMGELPTGGRLYHSCANPFCVRPSHIVWVVGRVMQQRLEAATDGYVGISGAPLKLDIRPRYWPSVVRVANEDQAGGWQIPSSNRRARAEPIASTA